MNGLSPRRLQAVNALRRVREVECRQAEARLNLKTMEMLKLRASIDGLRGRCMAVRSGAQRPLLRQRLLHASLVEQSIDHARRLDALRLQAAVLLSEYQQTKRRKDAADRLQARRRWERELVLARRQDSSMTPPAACAEENAYTKEADGECDVGPRSG